MLPHRAIEIVGVGLERVEDSVLQSLSLFGLGNRALWPASK
jgi:hypothetical protein